MAGAPIGNKYAVGNNGGRPRKYKTVSAMAKEIDAYFNSLDPIEDEETGKVSFGYPTVTGLALYLGFSSRDGIYEYRDRTEFSDLVKRALMKVEMHYETNLNYKACTGSIFALKNMGWKDNQNVEHSGKVEVNNNLAQLEEELAAIQAQLSDIDDE